MPFWKPMPCVKPPYVTPEMFRIQNISGVTYGGFTQGIGFQNGIHRHFHVCDPVKRVEDTEYIYTAFCCLFDECLDDVVRVVGIANAIGCPKQHLEEDVGRQFSHGSQAFPWTLREKP